MTTEVVREAGQYQLVNAGLGANGLFAVFCTKTKVITDWDNDSEWVQHMQDLDLDDFEGECEALIDAERENWQECAYCESLVPSCDYSDYENHYCSSDCKRDAAYLASNNGDEFAEHRTY